MLLGCGLGIVGSLAVSRVISSFLFGVSGTDPLVYSGGVLLMVLPIRVALSVAQRGIVVHYVVGVFGSPVREKVPTIGRSQNGSAAGKYAADHAHAMHP